MEARRPQLDNTENYAYIIKAAEIKNVKTENDALTQHLEENCFAVGNEGLRSFHKDFFGRNYRIEGYPFLGFTEELAKKIAELHPSIDVIAQELLTRKIAALPTFIKEGLLKELSQQMSVEAKLKIVQLFKSTNEDNEAILQSLFGSAVTEGELLIREKLIELYGLEVAENLIAAQSQESSYLSYRILFGAIFATGLFLRKPHFSDMVIFNEGGEFYLKVTNSHFPIFNSDDEEVAIIASPVAAFFKLGKNGLNQCGYELLDIRTNDKTIYDMHLGRVLSFEEVMETFGAQEKEVEATVEDTSSFNMKSAGLITLAVIGGGMATGGIAWGVGISALGVAATASLGAAGSGLAADKVVNRSSFFAPKESSPPRLTEVKGVSDPESTVLLGSSLRV